MLYGALLTLSLLTASPDRVKAGVSLDTGASLVSPSAHFGIQGALPLSRRLRLVARTEWNPWFSLSSPVPASRGVLNVLGGPELHYFEGRMFSSVQAGASVLLFHSAFDTPGTYGPAFAVVPAGFRFRPLDRVVLGLQPLSFHLLVPSLSSIPLVVFQYRSSVFFELELF